MKSITKTLASVLFVLLCPAMTKAQGWGQIQCTRADDTINLYSSMTSMEVRANLKCGEELQILNRYDNFLYVRTDKGVVGYVPLESVALSKTKHGAKPASAATAKKAAPKAPQMLTLFDGTPVRLKLSREVSSANAHTGDEVPFEVTEDVVVSGLPR
jgi:hypothetical protein